MKSISIVYPVYNEELNVDTTIRETLRTLPEITHDFEIIIVDDGSTDNTFSLLSRQAKLDQRIKILKNISNRGLGGALKRGFMEARKDVIIYSDFDLPFSLIEIQKAMKILDEDGADIVSAYRVNRRADGLKRLIYSCVYNNLIEFIYRIKIRDVNFSFKMFKNNVMPSILPSSEGSFVSAELLVRARLRKYKISQFPVVYHPRVKGSSKLSSIRVIIKILVELFVFYSGFYRNFRVISG